MKVLLSKNDLVTAVIRSQGAVSEKVLAHVGLKSENSQLRIVVSANSNQISSKKFSYMVEQIQFCVSTESPRPFALVALLHKPEKNKVRLVGSDGYRLSYAEMDGEFSSSFLTTGITLSKRALVELLKMCNEGFEYVHFCISEDLTTFMASVPDYEIFIRPSSVQYPNYQGVLPKGTLSVVDIPKNYIQSVAKRVLLAADRSRALHLSFVDDTLTVKARTVGSSEGSEKIVLENYNGPLREFSLNGKYLYDVFSAMTSNNIQLNFKSGEEPFVVVPKEEPEFCQSMHILVPIKENRES